MDIHELGSVQKLYETHIREKAGSILDEAGESEKEGEIEGDLGEEESEYRGSDPLTYVFWGVGMVLYAGYLIIRGHDQPKNDYWLLFYLVQPILFVIFGIYSIRYGIRQNRESKIVVKQQDPE